jgi:GT2 family glycosyltransferase
MSDAPRVALIIVNWNSGQCLKKCLSCVAKQRVVPWKTIVVDNGSTDDSLWLIKDRFEFVRIISLADNLGFALANNVAARETEGSDWIGLLNPDAFPEPEWLESLLESTRSCPGYSFYASRMMLNADPTVLDGAGDVYHPSGGAWRRGHNRVSEASDLEKVEVFGACAGAALYRRDAFLDVGAFDDAYFCYFEDVDLAFRLRLAGHRCLYVPHAVVRHVGSASTGERSDFTTYHGQRNLVWTYFKNMPSLLLWLYLPQHIFLNLAMLVWYSLRGQTRVIWKAKWDALTGLPRILRARRRIQRSRRISAWKLRQTMAKGLLTPYLRGLRSK